MKAAYLTLFWKLGYQYTLSLAGRSVGHEILGRFYLDNRGKNYQDVMAAAQEFFKPYVNMVRPVNYVGENAPRGTIEDNRAFVWLGSSGSGLGIGVFVRTNDRLQMVLMPGYSDAEAVATYLDFLKNKKEMLWVRDGEFNSSTASWDVSQERIPVLWPKTGSTFDLSRSAQELLNRIPPHGEQPADAGSAK